eukprot:Trichotokara_eunicae@DN915_c0_g1_i1.p1
MNHDIGANDVSIKMFRDTSSFELMLGTALGNTLVYADTFELGAGINMADCGIKFEGFDTVDTPSLSIQRVGPVNLPGGPGSGSGAFVTGAVIALMSLFVLN